MGLGDDMMFTGFAKQAHEMTEKLITTPNDVWSPMWDNIPYIISHKEIVDRCLKPDQVVVVDTHPLPGNGLRGLRWYMKSISNEKVVYNYDYKVLPTELVFTNSELSEASKLLEDETPFICLNPSIKNTTSADNKDWGWDKWVELSELAKDLPYKLVQIIPSTDYVDVSGHVKVRKTELDNCQLIVTENPRMAFAVLKSAKAMVTTEGGFSHAAGALKIPGVVIFGGFTPPEITNYPMHDPVYPDHPLSPCGIIHRSCSHCREVMESIQAEEIFNRLKEVLK